VGIELAHRLLTGGKDDVPDVYREPLARWREHVPDVVPPLLVVAGREDFDRWVAAGRPPALLKVHDSLAPISAGSSTSSCSTWTGSAADPRSPGRGAPASTADRC